MVNFINSWKRGNKKNKIDFCIRFGYLTILEINICLDTSCEKDCKCKRARLMFMNFGIEI